MGHVLYLSGALICVCFGFLALGEVVPVWHMLLGMPFLILSLFAD